MFWAIPFIFKQRNWWFCILSYADFYVGKISALLRAYFNRRNISWNIAYIEKSELWCDICDFENNKQQYDKYWKKIKQNQTVKKLEYLKNVPKEHQTFYCLWTFYCCQKEIFQALGIFF